jgi:RHS repeat-associated protein
LGGIASIFTYNIAHRLASISGGGATAASYQYGVLGERVAKTVGGVTTLFITGINGELLEERNLSTGAAQDYLYSNGLLVGLYNPASNTLYYVHTDRLGAPQFVTDALQSLVWSTAHDPYGNAVNLSGTLTNNIRLPGQYADAETGFFQNGFRDYMPNLGRYLETDPIGLNGGMNPYLYVGANPVRFTDSNGEGTSLIGPPGGSITFPNGNMRVFDCNGDALYDIDVSHDHGQGCPHVHNWCNGVRGPGYRFFLFP